MDLMAQGNQFAASIQQSQQHQPPHHSMQYNMRNNLLHDDIGNIDITKETPINGPSSAPSNQSTSQQFQTQQQQPLQQEQRAYPQHQPPQQQQYYPQASVSQQQHYNQQPQYYNNNVNTNQQFQNNSYNQRLKQQRNRPVAPKQEKKAYLLNQKSFTNFFKAKNHGLGFGKSKKNNGLGSGGGDDDEDGDVLIDDPDASTLSFRDIQKYGFKNGDKLNVTDDTTPLIPTLVTKQTNNMNNTEYRKYLNTQKKNALTAFNNQNKMQNSCNNNNMLPSHQSQPPRAMSLQAGSNPYLMQQQQQSGIGFSRSQNSTPFGGRNGSISNMTNIPNNNNGQDITGPRANSLMTGKPAMNYLQQQRQQQQRQQQGMPQQGGMNPPRTMSLTNNPNQRTMQSRFNNSQQQFTNNGPPPSNMNGQVPAQYRTMSLQQRPFTNTQGILANQQQVINTGNRQPPIQQQVGLQNQISPQYQQLMVNQPISQLDAASKPQNEVISEGHEATEGSGVTNPYLSVVSASAQQYPTTTGCQQATMTQEHITPPQLNSTESSNTFSSANSRPSSATSGTEVSSEEIKAHHIPPLQNQTAPAAKEQAPSIGPNPNKPRLNVIKLSKPKQDELLEQERLKKDIEREINSTQQPEVIEQQSYTINEPDLRPSSLLQGGLASLNLNEKNVRDSTMTQDSSFSISPVKHPKAHDRAIYKLANNTDSKAFVTAEEFPSSDYSKEPKDDIHAHGVQPVRQAPRRTSAVSVARASKRISIYKSSTNSTSTESFNSSKHPSRKEEENNQQHLNSPSTLTASSTTSRIVNSDKVSLSEPSFADINDTFDYKNPILESRESSNDRYVPPKDKDQEEFVFDNTLFFPYKDMSGTDAPKRILISKEQMGLLNENKRLMGDLTLLSSELAESIKREALLEDKIKTMNATIEHTSPDRRVSTISTSSISYADFETELRRKSSKIVELIQTLNEERMKRFIAEEQVLLKENNASPSSLDLIKKITSLEEMLQQKESAINDLKSALSKL